jgi:hypothetical protein
VPSTGPSLDSAGQGVRGNSVRPGFLLLAVAWGGWIWHLSSGVLHIGEPTFLWGVLRNGGHAVLFAVLSSLLLRGLPASRSRWAGAVACSIYGAIDEWHQSLVPGRLPALSDWITDTCGVSFGWALLGLLECWVARPERRVVAGARLAAAALACLVAAVLATL